MRVPPLVTQQIESLLPRLLELSGGRARPDHPGAFASEWLEQEAAGMYWAGVPDHSDRPALIFVVYAMRELNAGRQDRAAVLLGEAARVLQGVPLGS